jgi:Family of unknown function (DUF6788)
MDDPLSTVIENRWTLLRQILALGDFQPGSLTSAARRSGKPCCHCSKPNDPGHGPHFQLNTEGRWENVTQNFPSLAAMRKAEEETAEFRRFQALSSQLVYVNRKVCRLRPVEETLTRQEERRPI